MVSSASPSVEALPHWESTPEDLSAAIREIKTAIRASIEASGRSVGEVAQALENRISERVRAIEAVKAAGESAWPEIDFADIAYGTVTQEQRDLVKERGCLVAMG
jgi:hypothetical protein